MSLVDWYSADKVYLDKGIALELLDEIDEFRRNHQDEKKDPSDFCMRAIEAIIAKRCGMPSRADWTGELKARPSRYRRDLDAHGPGF